MPYPPNNLPARELFVGRQSELAQLELALSRPGGAASLVADGGTGKSWLARHYAYRAAANGTYPGGIWWLGPCAGWHAALRDLVATMDNADLPGLSRSPGLLSPRAPAGELASAIIQTLSAQLGASLLVLDDVDSRPCEELQAHGSVRLLMTTCLERLAAGKVVLLTTLNAEDVGQRVSQLDPSSLAYRLLVWIALSPFPPYAVPLRWAGAGVEQTEGTEGALVQEACARLEELGLVSADRARTVVMMHHQVAAAMRERARHDRTADNPASVYRLGKFHGREHCWGSARSLFQRGIDLARAADNPLLIEEGNRLLADAAGRPSFEPERADAGEC